MTRTVLTATFTLLLAATTTRGDGLLFGFDGDTLPGSGSDWVIADACELDCSRRLEDGHFIMEWGVMGDFAGFSHTVAEPPTPPYALGRVAVPIQPTQTGELCRLRWLRSRRLQGDS